MVSSSKHKPPAPVSFHVLTRTSCPSRVIEAVPKENVACEELACTETLSK